MSLLPAFLRGQPERDAIDPQDVLHVGVRRAADAGPSYPDEARFDLFIDGARSGYSMGPGQLKDQVCEHLDSAMRRIGGHGPEIRRSLAETAAEIERLRGLERPGGRFACLKGMDGDDLELLKLRIRRFIETIGKRECVPAGTGHQHTVLYPAPGTQGDPHDGIVSTLDDGGLRLKLMSGMHSSPITIVDRSRRGPVPHEERASHDVACLEDILLHLEGWFRPHGETGSLATWRRSLESFQHTCMAVVSAAGARPHLIEMRLPYGSTSFALSPWEVDVPHGILMPSMNEAISPHAPSTMIIEMNAGRSGAEYVIEDSDDLPDAEILDLSFDADRWIDPVTVLRLIEPLKDLPRPWTLFVAERGDGEIQNHQQAQEAADEHDETC
jgi:hypothetical protein